MRILELFIPKEQKFFIMLKDQTDNVMQAAILFNKFVREFNSLNQNQRQDFVKKISDLEHRGDRITHFIMDRLNESFITPIDKEDLHRLVMLLDDVIDLINVVTRQMVIYNLKSLDSSIERFGSIIQEGLYETSMAIHSLKMMKYSKKNAIRINQLENEADELFRKVIGDLFANGKDPVKIIKFKDICSNLELITDKIEDVSVVLDNIVIKNA